MKNIIIILTALLITASIATAQDVPVDSLKVKYESKLQQIEKEINDIIYQVAMNDPVIVQRLNQLLAVVPEYNLKVGQYNAVKELLTELEPKVKKQEGK